MASTLTARTREMQPREFGAILVVISAIGASLFGVLSTPHPVHTDALQDWIVVRATYAGFDPQSDINHLAEELGVDYVSPGAGLVGPGDIVIPRTPANFVLLAPMLAIPSGWAHVSLAVLNALSLALLLLGVGPAIARTSRFALLLPSLAIVFSIAFVQSLYWGNVSGIIGLMVGVAWLRSKNHVGSGTALGLAVAWKLYVGIAMVPLIMKRETRRAGLVAGVVAVAATLGGLVLIDMPLRVALQVLSRSSDVWIRFPGNWSLAGVLIRLGLPDWTAPLVVMLGIVAAWYLALNRPFNQAMSVAVCLAVLTSPLSWDHYDLLLIPAVFLLWAGRRAWRPAMFAAVAWLAANVLAQLVGHLVPSYGWALFGARVVLLVAVAVAPSRVWERSSPAS